MLIGYDGRFITRTPTGNGIYATRLLEYLSRVDERNRYRVYMAGPDPAIPPGLNGNVDVRVMHPWHRSAWFRVPISFPWELFRRPVDLFHAHYTIPSRIKSRVVLTLHDFFWIVHPELYVSLKRIPITWTTKRSVNRADHILVGTSFMRDEAVRHFGVPPERISVIPYGIDDQFLVRAGREHLAATRRKYGIDGPYLLAVGDIHPRKNLKRLFEAFAIMSLRDGMKLVLVGKPLWKTAELFDSIRRSGLEDQVIATGYVDAADLPPLYQAAEVFCYPSLYEGFGFPIIEGMASGVPVATSRASSCPDVGGEAVAYFDPTDVDDIARTLDRVVSDSNLREKLVSAGADRIREFSWERTARKTLEVYHALA